MKDERPGAPPSFAQRHTIAGLASVVMLTGWLGILGSNELLGELVRPDLAWERGLVIALAATVGVFFPWAAMSERVWGKRGAGVWAPPVILAAVAAGAGLAIEAVWGTARFDASFVVWYGALGVVVGMMFCGYWIPLKMAGRGR
ncbi:MAG: hypothetical protein ACAI43_15550 [Phycisphaerae bacterium]|nr:hypothetical protein [Tepidisphaeraceae bacterium]